MKKKTILSVILLFTIVVILNSYENYITADDPPISSLGWYYDGGITLKGEHFYYVSESYCETDGYAFVETSGKIHYWLYNTYKYHNGDYQELLDKYIPKWVESMGYTIDYVNIRRVYPNLVLAKSVKMLMKNRNSDVSVALITDNGLPYVVINNYEAKKQYFWTDVWPVLEDSIKLTEKAKSGDSNAQYNLGWMYENGKGVAKDEKKAVYWYTKAAEQGLADAQNNLGGMYEKGTGVTKEYKKAVYWYTKATEQGLADAQNNLGGMYYNGTGVAKEYKKAVYWYTKATEQGLANAQYNLGMMYENGTGVAKEYKKAVYWYTKAAEQGLAMHKITWL